MELLTPYMGTNQLRYMFCVHINISSNVPTEVRPRYIYYIFTTFTLQHWYDQHNLIGMCNLISQINISQNFSTFHNGFHPIHFQNNEIQKY